MSGSPSRLLSPATLNEAQAASDLLRSAQGENEAARHTAAEYTKRIEREARQRGEALGLRELVTAAKALRVERRSWLDGLAPQLIALTVKAVGDVINNAAVDGQIAAQAVRARLDALDPGPTLRITVHPDDLEAVGATIDRAAHTELTIFADPTMEPGGCIIDSPHELYDGRIETRLGQLQQAMQASEES